MIDIISSPAVSQNPFPRKLSCELKARRSNQRRDWRPAKVFPQRCPRASKVYSNEKGGKKRGDGILASDRCGSGQIPCSLKFLLKIPSGNPVIRKDLEETLLLLSFHLLEAKL